MAPANEFMVSVGGAGQGDLQLLNPPRGPITREQAVGLAAWLLVLADPLDELYPEVRRAVENT